MGDEEGHVEDGEGATRRPSSSPATPLGFGRVEPFLAAALVAASLALCLHHVAGDAATSDEPVHIASAVEIVRQGTGRWNPEHPPLAKALAGLALTGLPLDPAADPLRTAPDPARLVRFLYGNRTPSETILWRARLPFVLLLGALLVAVRAAARRHFGAEAGLLALALAAFDPNLSASAGVVHTDLAVTLLVLLSLGPLERLARPEARRAWLGLGCLWGLAFLSKYSAPLLVLVTLPFLAARETPRRAELPRLLARLAASAALALAVTLAGFAVAERNQSAADRRELAVRRLEQMGRSAPAARLAVAAGDALPPAGNLLTGTLSIALQSEVGAGVNYFLGRVSREGSPFYFPVALATKAPLGLLLAVVLGAAAPCGRRVAAAAGASLLLFLLASARTTYNIGVRHALLFFPLGALVASAAAASASWAAAPAGADPRPPGPRRGRDGPRLLRWAACGAAVVTAVELVAVHPYEMSFFNAAAGGLAGGRRIFVDSNLDWGQDLLRLARAAPAWEPRGLPSVVFGGDFPARHGPALRPVLPGDEDRPGALLAIGEQPLATGPEFLESKGARPEAERLGRLRHALLTRGVRVGEIGGSIGIWRIERPPGTPPPGPSGAGAPRVGGP